MGAGSGAASEVFSGSNVGCTSGAASVPMGAGSCSATISVGTSICGTASFSFSTGDVYVYTHYRDEISGRIVAEIEDSSKVENCYADGTQTINGSAYAYCALQFTVTLQSENFIYNTLGWSSDIWQINEGGFPTLK